MQNLNTKGKDVLAVTLHTTLKVIFIAVYICKYKKKWLCIFEFSKLSEALYHSYSKESLVGFFSMMSFRLLVSTDTLTGFIQFFFRLCPADSVKNKKKKAEGDVCPLEWWSFESCSSSHPSIVVSLFSCVTAITIPLVQGKRCWQLVHPLKKKSLLTCFWLLGSVSLQNQDQIYLLFSKQCYLSISIVLPWVVQFGIAFRNKMAPNISAKTRGVGQFGMYKQTAVLLLLSNFFFFAHSV